MLIKQVEKKVRVFLSVYVTFFFSIIQIHSYIFKQLFVCKIRDAAAFSNI